MSSSNSVGSAAAGGARTVSVNEVVGGEGDKNKPPPPPPPDTDIGVVFENPSKNPVPISLLLGPYPGVPPTDSHNCSSTGGCLNIITHVKDGFLDMIDASAAHTYLYTLALTMKELTGAYVSMCLYVMCVDIDLCVEVVYL